jgi:hypothetical protein
MVRRTERVLYFLSCAQKQNHGKKLIKHNGTSSERSERVANQIREEDWSALQSELQLVGTTGRACSRCELGSSDASVNYSKRPL